MGTLRSWRVFFGGDAAHVHSPAGGQGMNAGIAHALLVRVAPALLSRSAVQNKAAPRLGQIAASYRGTPIAKGGGGIGRLMAGDRVPDVYLPQGRLYELLDPSRLTLFVTGDPGTRHGGGARMCRRMGSRHRRSAGRRIE